MQSFLHGSSQQVCVKGSLSSKGLKTVGVPQDSILGLLLFSLYVNDLPTAIKEVELIYMLMTQSYIIVIPTLNN